MTNEEIILDIIELKKTGINSEQVANRLGLTLKETNKLWVKGCEIEYKEKTKERKKRPVDNSKLCRIDEGLTKKHR